MHSLLAIANIFIDPPSSVAHQRQAGRFAWLPPLLITALATILFSLLLQPYMQQALQNDLAEKMSAEQAADAAQKGGAAMKIGLYMSPAIIAVILLINSAIVLGFSTMLGTPVTFHAIFTLLAHCGLIPMLAGIAQMVVIRLRGGMESMKEMQPAFGLDLMLGADAPNLLRAFLNYFSLFTIWYIIVLGIGFAALAAIPKARAFAITSPVWILGLFMALLGGMFR